jgi:tetratricopeptide (TPR) repeat protein
MAAVDDPLHQMERLLMRRLNVKLFLWLVGSVVLLSATVFFVHRLQAGRIANALLWQAGRAEEQGHLDQTAQYLARYLEFAPEDTEQRARLGRVLASESLADSPGARQRALFVLEQVVTREPQRHDARRLLVRVALQLQQFQLAEPHLDVLREAFPGDGEVEQLMGRWHEGEGRYAEAAEWLRKAVTDAPHEVDNYVRLADLLRHRLKGAEPAQEADRVIDALVAQNEQAYRAYLGRWQYRRAAWTSEPGSSELATAGQDVARALELAPLETETVLAAADLALLRAAADPAELPEQLTKARTHLQEGIKLHPQDMRLYRSLAGVELRADRRDRAVACLRSGAKAVPRQAQFELLWDLANLLIDGSELSEADEVIAQIRQTDASPASVDYLNARLRIHDGHWPEAANLLERARPHFDGVPELVKQVDLLLAECYGQLAEPKRQQAAYERVLAVDPACIAARLGMAALQSEQDQVDNALAQYRQLMTQKGAPPAGRVEIARLLLLRNLQRLPNQRDWKEVDNALDEAAKAQPESVDVPLLRAKAFLAQNDAKAARAALLKASDQHPKQVELWTALAELSEREGDFKEAERLLKTAENLGGDTVELRLARARSWAGRPAEARAKDALKPLGEKVEQFSSDDQCRLLQGLAEASYRAGNAKEAQRYWSRLAQQPRHANDIRLRLLLFELALQEQDQGAVDRLLGELRQLEGGQGTFWSFCEAWRLSWKAKEEKGDPQLLDQARELLDTVASRRPNWAPVMLVRADIEQLKGNIEQAIANYQQAIAAGEHNPRVVRQLVQLLIQRNRFSEAEQLTAELQKQGLIPADMQRLAVDISLRSQEPTRAVQQAIQAVSADPKDYRDCLWLGQVMAAAAKGRPSPQAEEKLRRAVELAPEVPEPWIVLVQYLAKVDRPKAQEAILQAGLKLKGDQRPLALAQCYEAVGELAKARDAYEKAQKEKPADVAVLQTVAAFALRDGRLKDGAVLLRQIMDRKVNASDSEAAWARRALAVALATGGAYDEFLQALGLVGLSLDREGNVVEDRSGVADDLGELRVRAAVLATQNAHRLRAKAIDILEELNKRRALTANDQLRLARLYEAHGEPRKALEQLGNLATAHDDDPLLWTYYAQSLLRQRPIQVEEAQGCVDKLKRMEKEQQVEPGSFGTVELQAQVLEARGKADEAIGLLEKRIRDMGEKANPDEYPLVISYLSRRQRVDDALNWCEEAWKHCSPDVAGSASVTVLRNSTQPTAAQCARVEGWLRQALQANDRITVLRLHLADVLDLEKQFDEAQSLYEEVLKREPNNAMALNNLAWLRAQHSHKGTEALEIINKAIQIGGPRAELLDTRAVIYLTLERPGPAIADLQEAIADAPTPARYFHLARAQHQARNQGAAVKAFRIAQNAGLEPQHLHPVERVAYVQMAREFEQK